MEHFQHPMRPRVDRRAMAWLCGALMLTSLMPSAWALDPPKGKVILTMTGKVGATNVGEAAQFDLAMLQQLPQRSFTTQTPWEKQPIQFTGPLLRDVVAAVKGTGTVLQATALNDYKIRIPLSDATAHDVIVAHAINGQTISVRTKGPLFVVYPFDSKPELKSNTYYERSIWQLKSFEFQ